MNTNQQQRECYQRLLRGYLKDTLSDADQQRVEDHLCQCQQCRDTISDSAAEKDWWGRAATALDNALTNPALTIRRAANIALTALREASEATTNGVLREFF